MKRNKSANTNTWNGYTVTKGIMGVKELDRGKNDNGGVIFGP